MILNYDQYLITEKFGNIEFSKIENLVKRLLMSKNFVLLFIKELKYINYSKLEKYVNGDVINLDKIISDIPINEKVDVYKWFRKEEDYSDIDPKHEENWDELRKRNIFYDVLNGVFNFPINFCIGFLRIIKKLWSNFKSIDFGTIIILLFSSTLMTAYFMFKNQSKYDGPVNGKVISMEYIKPHYNKTKKDVIYHGHYYSIDSKIYVPEKWSFLVEMDGGYSVYKYSWKDPNLEVGERGRMDEYHDDLEKMRSMK